MERYVEYQVQAEDLPSDVGGILRKQWKMSARQISRLKFRTGGICVNGVPVRVNHRLNVDDRIRICLEEKGQGSLHLEAVPGRVDIRWEDEDLLIVNKASGVPVHPSHGHYCDTLANHLVDHYRKRDMEIRVRPVGRLDKDTSGLVLFAKHQVAAAMLSKETAVYKEYLALVYGCPAKEKGCVNAPIKAMQGKLNQMTPDDGGKPAVTHYEVVRKMEGCSLLRLWLEHGRTHQIRVHMAMLGHPLLGDGIYGPVEEQGMRGIHGTDGIHGITGSLKRAALHCERMRFVQPFTKERMEVWAPIPEDMERIIRNGTIKV